MHPKIKVLLDFFQKIAESRGRASGRPPQRAKYPLAAASEIPAPRTARNPPASQSAIRRWRNPRQSRRPPFPPLTGWWTAALCRTVSDDISTLRVPLQMTCSRSAPFFFTTAMLYIVIFKISIYHSFIPFTQFFQTYNRIMHKLGQNFLANLTKKFLKNLLTMVFSGARMRPSSS